MLARAIIVIFPDLHYRAEIHLKYNGDTLALHHSNDTRLFVVVRCIRGVWSSLTSTKSPLKRISLGKFLFVSGNG